MPKARRVAFSGAEVIEYDASLAPVVKLYGAGEFSDTRARTLECQARGVDVSDENLTVIYIKELQRFLRSRGFEPMSVNLLELQIQRRVVELLLTCVALELKEKSLLTVDVLDPKTFQRVQLATKQLEGRVDDSYAFGRRFVTISTYVDMLSSEELLAAAHEREIQLPTLGKKLQAGIKAKAKELLGRYGTAKGRPLNSLTLRQLVIEVEERGLLGPEVKKINGKKSKRAWVDLLRPVMVSEVKASKIYEQQEKMLREKLVYEMEREKEEEQKQRVIELISKMIEQSFDMVDSTKPEIGNANLKQEKSIKQVKTCRYLEALVKTICVQTLEKT
ncbi:uncharacterized protein PHALS_04393 [Plasmopara halstedii]|uniref:Uncharacterized protein n=1 Tax=Plasmopara halstedii TaxID=4781 RepID=A0A0P1B0H3_PLAHL|nr:uncharacterized protein PHALS_04393 [Plasmopara halstedii]CEG47525.1 hypothetical protein PHALS_04393 [Plasmopara halstedii]|eukprot:XP_024583894.1 hypothetical protein PHALS_04393 [Plasmopara halstedii]